MSGLLTKDLRLLLQRKNTLLLFLMIVVILGYSMDGNFIIGYSTILMASLALSTLSYDEMDNGLTFLMTLPIDVKAYVREKFLFGIASTVLAWGLSFVFILVKELVEFGEIASETVISGFVVLPLAAFIIALFIPIIIKFGHEKSRVVLMLLAGICAICGFVLIKVGSAGRVELFTSASNAINNISPVSIAIVAGVVSIVIMIISYFLSVLFLKRKQL